MSSDLNFNVKSNASLPQDSANVTAGTNASVKTDTSAYQSIQKDSVNQSEQPQVAVNLSAYVANTSRPILPKPPEGSGMKRQDVATRDIKSENEAGTLATGESKENIAVDDQPITQQDVEQKEKKQDQDQGQGGGSSGDGDHQESAFASKTLSELVANLEQFEKQGKIQKFDSDQISELLNNFSKGGSVKFGAKVEGAKVEGADEPYPEMTIKGNTITGPNGVYTIPEPQSPPKSPSDMLTNMYHQMNGIATSLQAMSQQIPEGPEKITLANFLKTLLTALTKFQQFLYVMNNVDSKTIREKSQAQLETSLHKLDEQRKSQEEQARKAREAGKKSGIMGILGKVFGAVGISMSFVLVVVAVALMISGVGAAAGTALLAVTITFLVVSIASMITAQATGKGIFERAFEGIGKLVSALLSAMGISGEANEWITLIAKIVLVVLVCVIVIASSPVVFLMGGVSNIIGLITESGIINSFVEKCGGDKKAQMITTIVVTAAIMLITMVVSIVMMFIPGAQANLLGSLGSATEKITTTITQAITKALKGVLSVSQVVAEKVTNVIMAILKFIVNPGFWVTVAMTGMQTASTINTVKMHKILADIAMMEGQMTKMIEATDALITMFKKIIQKLIEGLTETGTFISQTSDLIKKIVQGQSESLSNIWSA